jgi:hypothetical protein
MCLVPVRRHLVLTAPPRHDRSPVCPSSPPGLAVEEHHVLPDGGRVPVECG